MLFAYLALIALTSVVIMYACNTFEDAADHLGRNMAPGVKGATINAIGSSLPELFTTMLFLFGPAFLVKNSSPEELFSAGIATCAGSAIFNAVIIPGLCILAVMFIGVKKKGGREKVTSIELNKKVVVKDGFFFLFSEIALIYFLGMQKLTYIMGFSLMAIYVIYILVTLKGGFAGDDEDDDGDHDEGEDDEDESGVGLLGLGWLLDFNARFFGGREFSEDEGNGRAWVLLSLSTIFIGIACGGVVYAVEGAAHELGVSLYVTAVLLAAAATSVPDTVLSVKDAMKGDYDDAVANAVGSNIFDICICLGFPLALYSLINSDIMLQSDTDGGDVQILRFILILASVLILAIFLIGRSIGKVKAVMLFSIYFLWTAFIIGGAQTPKAEWTQAIKVPAFLSVQSAPADGATKAEPKADTKTEEKPADK
jgi:cation:H+ antiporter